MSSKGIARGLILTMAAIIMGITGCTRDHAPAAMTGAVKMNIGAIGIDHRTGLHYVLLQAENGGRALPIMVGDNEARAIMMAMHGLRSTRPQTEDLLGTVIQTTGNQVDRVLISDMRNDVYFADIYLDDGKFRIDCRPSDAIALAMTVDAPIYVAERLLGNGAPTRPRAVMPPTADGLGLTVQELTPRLAKYFHSKPSSGVLVVIADNATGLRRGDVVERIGTIPVRSLEEFEAAVAANRGNSAVPVVFARGGIASRMELKPWKNP